MGLNADFKQLVPVNQGEEQVPCLTVIAFISKIILMLFFRTSKKDDLNALLVQTASGFNSWD